MSRPIERMKPVINAGAWRAYNDNKMTRDEKVQFEKDYAEGLFSLPEGAEIQQTEPKAGFLAQVADVFTGKERRTAQTEQAPDWGDMPEMNSFSFKSLKAAAGTLLTSPEETVKVLQAQYPGIKVRQDEKGNFMMRSSIDGKEYAIKPGAQVSDIPRAAAGMLGFTQAGRALTVGKAALGAAGTQAAVEASQAATGGEFNPEDVAIAGALGGAVPAVTRMVKAGTTALKPVTPVRAVKEKPLDAMFKEQTAQLEKQAAEEAELEKARVERLLGKPLEEVRMPSLTAEEKEAALRQFEKDISSAKGGATPAELAIKKETDTIAATKSLAATSALKPDIVEVARKAAKGDLNAQALLAKQAAPNRAIIESARRLGTLEYLQPDHYSTNQAFRALSAVLKEAPGSSLRAQEVSGIKMQAQRADEVIKELGGTSDYSGLEVKLRGTLETMQGRLKEEAGRLYNAVDTAIPANTPVDINNVKGFIANRMAELGGADKLSTEERAILKKLNTGRVKQVLDERGLYKEVPIDLPTYALLDDVRKLIGTAKRNSMKTFGDAPTALLTQLEKALRTDQRAAIMKAGDTQLLEKFDAAQALTRTRKGVEDDLASLFGRDLDRSFTGGLSGAIKGLPAGDVAKFTKLLKVIPEDMRQEVVSSGLATAFGKSAKSGDINFGNYADWYEGVQRNKQAYTALMSNLPRPARGLLNDLYNVSKGIRQATNEQLPSGSTLLTQRTLEGSDRLIGKMLTLGGQFGLRHFVREVGDGQGAIPALTRILFGGSQTAAVESASKVLGSAEFKNLLINMGTDGEKRAAKALASSGTFTRFWKVAKTERPMGNPEQWILSTLQGTPAQDEGVK